MSEVRLVVREAEQDWSGTIRGSCADKAVAALSGDPVTLSDAGRPARPVVLALGRQRHGRRVRVFGIGCHLAELIAELRDGASREDTPAEAQASIDQLNRDFGNLREVLQSADASLAAALIDPALDRFADTLATLAASRADLTERCDSLAADLGKLLAPPPPEPTWDVDDDIPL